MHRLLFCAALLLTACATRTLIEPQSFATARQFIHLVDGGPPWEPQFRYTLADDELVIEHLTPRRHGLEISRQKRVRLDVATARTLWTAIDRLGVTRWRDSYHPDDLGTHVFDGTSWSVLVRMNGVEKSILGFNVYPSLDPLGAPKLEDRDTKGNRVNDAYNELLLLFRRYDREKG